MKIFYLCDHKAKCKWSPICNTEDGCNHTSDESHALKGKSEDPENDERFIETPQGDLWEQEGDKRL